MSLLSSLMMDVFVIPIGPERYELYGEQPAEEEEDLGDPPSGLIDRLRHKVSVAIRAAEERRHREHPDEGEPKGFIGRIQDRMMAWVVERMAEQKLLWSLRGQTKATVAHPQDMSFDQVLTLVRRILRRDYDRHRRWMFIDGVLFIVTFVTLGPLFVLIPGIANLPALYFGFRALGHWLSMRGASQGLHRVEWTGRPCPPLGELRDLAVLEPRVRHERIHDVAARLRLQHLSTFFERVAIHHA
jgi:hypothetical protein